MKFAILHLSDIHIKNTENHVFDKVNEIINSIKNKLFDEKFLFIVTTGDIANTGNNQEYNEAINFYKKLEEELAIYLKDLSIKFIFSPGNHDCDFSISNDIRELVLEKINKDDFEIDNIKKDYISNCVSVQENYFNFKSELEDKSTIYEPLNSSLFTRYEFKLDDYIIAFNSYNFSFMSSRNEEQSRLKFPCKSIRDTLQSRTSKPKSINISLYHHPLHWLNHRNIRSVRELINSTSEIVLTGHEHTSTVKTETDINTNSTHYIESSALQTSNANESSFKLIKIDLESKSEVIDDFSWEKESYTEIRNNSSINLDVKNNHYELKDEYFQKINSLGAQLSHKYKSDVTLEDLFIYQDLQVLNTGDMKVKENAKSLKDFEKIEKTLILGAETSGKTSLSYMLQIYYKRMGKLPIYISGTNLSKKDYDFDKIENLIEKNFLLQYHESLLDAYKKEDVSNILILIDEFDKLPFNNKYKGLFLNNLSKKYKNIILFAHDSFELEVFNDEILNDKDYEVKINNFNHYKIREFGHLLRDKLIKKWLILGREDIINTVQLHQEVVESAKTITSTVGLNIVPSYPLYLLTLLQAMAGNSAASLTESSYGHYYSHLITHSFVQNGINRKDWELYFNFCSSLAFDFFKNQNYKIDEEDLERFYSGYKSHHKIPVKYSTIEENLLKTKILNIYNGEYKFSFEYLYYFFVSKYLADNIHMRDIQVDIEKLVKNSYRIEFGNILMFLVHHSNKDLIINLLLEQTKQLFNDSKEFKFCDNELQKINGTISGPKVIQIEEQTIDETRKKQLSHYEERDNKLIKSDRDVANINESIEISKLDLFAKLNLAFKLTNILGEVAKNYYGSLSGDLKLSIIKETYALNLRALNIFVSNFEKHHALVEEAVMELLDKKGYVTSDKIETSAKRLIFNMIARLTEGFISKLSKSVANKDLMPIFKELKEENSTNKAFQIISLAIDLDFPKGLKTDVVKHYNSLEKNYLAQEVILRLVVDHLYMYHVDHKIKDSVMDQLGINKTVNNNILVKKNQNAINFKK